MKVKRLAVDTLSIPYQNKAHVEAMLDIAYNENNSTAYATIRKVIINLGLTIKIRADGSHQIIRVPEYVELGIFERGFSNG